MTFNIIKATTLTFALLLICTQGSAKIYKWVDSDGQTHFSQERPAHLKTKSTNNKKINTASLKSFLYPFGSAAILKESKKAYCNKKAALRLLQNKISMKKRELRKYKKKYAIRESNYQPENRIYRQKRLLEQEISLDKSRLTKKLYKERFLSAMRKKCLALEKRKIINKEIYDIGRSGYKRVFKKEDRKYIGYIGIGISKYYSRQYARNKWNAWNRKANQKKYTRVEKEYLNGFNVLLMDDNASFAVGFILLNDMLIEIQFGSDRFVEFKQLQYFLKRYTRWLAARL